MEKELLLLQELFFVIHLVPEGGLLLSVRYMHGERLLRRGSGGCADGCRP